LTICTRPPAAHDKFVARSTHAASRHRRRRRQRQSPRRRPAALPPAGEHRGSDRDAHDFLDRAIPIVDGLDNPLLWTLVRGNVALTALLTGETEAAREAFRDELRLSRELVVLPFASEALCGLAAVAAVHDDVHRAARLSGAAGAYRYGRADDAVDERLEATFLAPAGARCGADAWHDTAREGAALSFDNASAYALEAPRA
jgi:hypothetical protein